MLGYFAGDVRLFCQYVLVMSGYFAEAHNFRFISLVAVQCIYDQLLNGQLWMCEPLNMLKLYVSMNQYICQIYMYEPRLCISI